VAFKIFVTEILSRTIKIKMPSVASNVRLEIQRDQKGLFELAERKDAGQRSQRFCALGWEVSFEETFHRRFAVLAQNVHGLHHRSKPYQFSPGW
jgi:hypothetical protein